MKTRRVTDTRSTAGRLGTGIPQGSTGTKTFTAHWKENFTITFNEGAHGSITTQNVFVLPDGSPFPTPPGVTEDARLRRFDGWPTMPATVTEDRTFTATYTPIEYDIVYIMNDGTNNPANPDTYTIETPTITLEDPTRDGYTFDGWTPGDSIPQGSTGTKTFTAHWEINKYTVTFDVSGPGSLDGDTSFPNIPHGTAWDDAVTVPTPVPNTHAYFRGLG